MKHGVTLFSFSTLAVLLAASLTARADSNPDFDDDAKPILRTQPGLLQYVESRFDVKDTGTAKYPGDDDRRPSPPYIFRARPLGSHGPYNLRLLIQPGPVGHVLGVVDITKAHLSEPGAPAAPQYSVASRPPSQSQPPAYQAPASQAPVTQAPPLQSSQAPAAEQPSEPTADTPSGPIMAPGSQSQSGSSPQQNLAPPPDPAPAAQ